MKVKLIFNYIIAIINFIAVGIAISRNISILFILCGIVSVYLVINIFNDTYDYLEYRRTEKAFIQYLLDNKDKLFEAQNNRECDYIFGSSLDNETK